MSTSRRARLASIVGAALLALASMSVAAAAPAPAYTVGVSDDGACGFTATASWKNIKVGEVFARWYLDGEFRITQQAPPVRIRANSVTFQAGPFASTAESHSWTVLFDFYSKAGVALAQVETSPMVVNCGIAP